MRNVKQTRRTLALGAAAAIGLALAGTALPVFAQPYNDAVWDLQQALQVRPGEAGDPATLKLREATLKKIILQLHTISELRRALTLTGWRDKPTESSSRQAIVGRPGAAKGPQDILNDIDSEARKEVGELLAKRILEEARRGDVTTRLALAAMLGDMGTSVRALGDSVMWKGRIPPPGLYIDWRGYSRRFTPLLVKLTRDPNQGVRVAAARALGKINPDLNEAVPALQYMLKNDAVPERRAAADGLLSIIREISKLAKKGQTQSGVEANQDEVLDASTAVTPVAGLGAEDRDVVVRRLSLATLLDAAISLSNLIPEPFDSKEVPPKNITLTPFQVKQVRALAAEIRRNEDLVAPLTKLLSAQGDRLARAVTDPDSEVRLLARRTLEFMANSRLRLRHCWESLPDLKTETTAGASAQLERNDLAGEIAFTAVQAKDSSDEGLLLKGLAPGVKAVAQRLQDPNPVNRRATIDFLEMLEDAAAPAVPALIDALSDPDIFVRWSAARTLGRIDAKIGAPAVPALAKCLSDPDLDVRVTAAASLEAFGPAARAAVPALADGMARGDPEFRRAIMYALQSIGPEASRAAIPNLIVNLRDDDPRVRRTAAETLGRFGPAARNAVPALRLALQDHDADVRQAVSDALLSILPGAG